MTENTADQLLELYDREGRYADELVDHIAKTGELPTRWRNEAASSAQDKPWRTLDPLGQGRPWRTESGAWACARTRSAELGGANVLVMHYSPTSDDVLTLHHGWVCVGGTTGAEFCVLCFLPLLPRPTLGPPGELLDYHGSPTCPAAGGGAHCRAGMTIPTETHVHRVLSREAVAVVAGLLSPTVKREGILASPEVRDELAARFPVHLFWQWAEGGPLCPVCGGNEREPACTSCGGVGTARATRRYDPSGDVMEQG